jgi:superfamily I DNA/RNA helicase
MNIEELERVFQMSEEMTAVLKDLATELSHRKTPRARALAAKVTERLRQLGEGQASEQHNAAALQAKRNKGEHRRHKSTFNPTAEQIDCLRRFQNGESFKITAFAGTGKTSTLRLLAESTSRKGLYLAFNKAAATEALESFPPNVRCSTTSSLAHQAMRLLYSREKLTTHVNANKLAEDLNLRDVQIGPNDLMKARSLAALIQRTLRNFMYSDSDLIRIEHVPQFGRFVGVRDEFWAPIKICAFEYAKRVWQRMCDGGDAIPLGFDGYLKLWALSNPVLETEFIFLDEAQDTNPVVKRVVEQNSRFTQVVYVGDRHQQIYEWMGAINAMDGLGRNLPECCLTTSFRFGQAIADGANEVLKYLGEKRKISGNPAISSRIGENTPDAILARTNATVISELICAIDQNRRPHIARRTKQELERLMKGVGELKAGRPTDVPEWFGFENWSEVVEFVQNGEDENLRTFVNLVQTRTEKQILWALGQTVDEKNADVTFSTAHQAKGLQWRHVRLADDFPTSRLDKNGKPRAAIEAEARLFYVAMTRAQESVHFNPATLALFAGERQTKPSSHPS